MSTLFVEGCGAVTPVGLSSFTSCAAIRAGICRVADTFFPTPPAEPLKGSEVKAKRTLKRTPREWLLNMAAKALAECVEGTGATPPDTVLLVCAPEGLRRHPAMAGGSSPEWLEALGQRAGLSLHPRSRVLEGAADLAVALAEAQELLRSRVVDRCVVGGVDSLINGVDLERLQTAGRMHGPTNPQGVIPGEGAAFLSLSGTGREGLFVPLATILGCGTATEPNPASGPKFSVGDGLVRAVTAALADARVAEAQVDFVASNHSGERYTAWELTYMHARTYRTRRAEGLATMYPASCVGDLGAASSALSLLAAVVAVARGYAPGAVGVCEFHSEGDRRGACVVTRAPLEPAFESPRHRARRR